MTSMLQMRNGSSERCCNLPQVLQPESSRVETQIEIWNYQKPLQAKYTQSYPKCGNSANVCLLYSLPSSTSSCHIISSSKSQSASIQTIQCLGRVFIRPGLCAKDRHSSSTRENSDHSHGVFNIWAFSRT